MTGIIKAQESDQAIAAADELKDNFVVVRDEAIITDQNHGLKTVLVQGSCLTWKKDGNTHHKVV